MISQKDPKSKGIEGAFMEKSEMRKLAEFIEKLSWDDLPEEVKTTVSFRVLDLISAALGAVDDPLVKKVKASYLERNNGTGGKIWGSEGETDISTAAYINAMLAHTLELDDVHPASKTHGSASLIPAAWSCARYVHASGKEFLTAVVCGYETVSRIGMALGVTSHRKKGWHATATCGGFGCAAACGKLLGLNADELVSALGMAGTQSFGRWAFLGDGSTCKVLHPARADRPECIELFLGREEPYVGEPIKGTGLADGGFRRAIGEPFREVERIDDRDQRDIFQAFT